MKKVLILIASVVFCNYTTTAQKIVETFDSNTFGWNEHSNKKGSANIEDGYLKLNAKKKCMVASTATLPINVDTPFKITAKLFDPGYQRTDAYYMFVYDVEEGRNNSVFVIGFNSWALSEVGNKRTIKNSGKLKSSATKDKTIIFTMESNFKQRIFKINDVIICEIEGDPLTSSKCGFLLRSSDSWASELWIDEIVIE